MKGISGRLEPRPEASRRRYALTVTYALCVLILSSLLASSLPAVPEEPPQDQRDLAGDDAAEAIARLSRERRYAEALAKAREVIHSLDASGQGESVGAAEILDLLVDAAFRSMATGAEVRALAERAVSLRERLLGPRDPTLATSLKNLGNLLRAQGNFSEAIVPYEKGFAILVEAYGPEALEITPLLNNLGSTFGRLDDLTRARALLERSLAIREKHLPAGDLAIGRAFNNLAAVVMEQGDYPRAEGLFRRTLAIREKKLDPMHPQVAGALNNLANALVHQGKYDAAVERHRRAVEILEENYGRDHEQVAMYLLNVGTVRIKMGDYAGARAAYERSLRILEMRVPPDHTKMALPLNNHGYLLMLSGDLTDARPRLERALGIRRRVLGPDHPDVAQTLSNLARLNSLEGDRVGADNLYAEVLAIRRRALGENHPDVAGTLNNRAVLHASTGDYARAGVLYRQALEIQKQALGPEHPEVATTMGNLADLLFLLGAAEEARPLLKKTLEIREKVLGPTHPARAVTLASQARLLAGMGNTDEALAKALEAEEIGREHARLALPSLPERQALAFAAVRPRGLPLALSLAARGLEPAAREKVWDQLIRSRALVMDEITARRRAMNRFPDVETERLEKELADRRRRLAHLVLAGPDSEHPEGYRGMLEQARKEKEEAERALAERIAGSNEEPDRKRTGWPEVAATLPPGAALIAFAVYPDLLAGDPREERDMREGPPAVSSYLAFVQPPGGDPPLVVPVAPASVIKDLVLRWQDEIGTQPFPTSAERPRNEETYRSAGEALRRVIWDPLISVISGSRQIFVVPDGVLHLVNLATLPVEKDRYLLEVAPPIHILPTERDLVRSSEARWDPEWGPSGQKDLETSTATQEDGDVPVAATEDVGVRGQAGERREGGLLLVGAPDFDATPRTIAEAGGTMPKNPAKDLQTLAGPETEALQSASLAFCGDRQALHFVPLPSALDEVNDIERLWRNSHPHGPTDTLRVEKLIGPSASAGAFKLAATGKQVLHLASHVFFLEPHCPPGADERYIENVRQRWGESPLLPRGIRETSLLFTGIALAGANLRLKSTRDTSLEDGILTAEEIASMDLTGVSWVVISGCETGLGKILPGEGVLGLQRAFMAAGARTVIMSLWKVRDEAALEWMKHLYRGRLRHHLTTSESVRKASLDVLTSRRRSGRTTHPFFWGAFVASGEWR